MPTNNEDFDVTSDNELRSAVRGLTDYDEGMVDGPSLRDLTKAAKRELALQADITSFYDDRGTAVALTGTLCALAKGHVENSPVLSDNIGPNDVTFRTTDGSSLQVAQYESMVQRGLANADTTDAGTKGLRLTNTFYGDT